MTTSIFVFGSNLRGIHGAGAAKAALDFYGAKLGLGAGCQGVGGQQGMSYALPTCTLPGVPLPMSAIILYVEQLLDYTLLVRRASVDIVFKVTRVGCGHAGFRDSEMAPLFVDFDPSMAQFDATWAPWLGKKFTYWIRT